MFALVAAARDRSIVAGLTSWDGRLFLRIAAIGYPPLPTGLAGADVDTSMAFFPAYPLLMRFTDGLTGIGLVAAGFVVTAVAGAALGIGLVELAHEVGMSRRVGLLWVAVAGASPLSVVFIMTYTEALFCALATWALVAVLRWQWPLAALLAIAAGVTRPTGGAIIAVVVLGALLEGWRTGGRRRVVCWASAAVAPAGLLGYLAFVAARSGSVTGWFQIQVIGWDTRMDGGRALLTFVGKQLANPWSLMGVATVAVVLAMPLLVWAAARIRLPWPLMLYALLVVAMALLSGGVMNSKIRLLTPALPLLLPVATGLSRLRVSTQVVTLVVATAVSGWFGAYCLLIYTHAI